MEIEEKREEVKVEKEMPTSTGDCYTRYLNGYIDEKTVNEVYKLDDLDNSKNYFVLALNGGKTDNQDYCDVGDITFSLSWMVNNKPIYLCKEYKKYINTKIK